VDEGLRIDSPVIGMPRLVRADTTLGGAELRAGDQLCLLYTSANHDSAHYADPDTFDLGRPQTSPMLTFGRGIHYCLGAGLARLEGKLALRALRERLPNMRIVDPGELERRPSALFRGFRRLDVTWTPPQELHR
jgi:cytochrome P450